LTPKKPQGCKTKFKVILESGWKTNPKKKKNTTTKKENCTIQEKKNKVLKLLCLFSSIVLVLTVCISVNKNNGYNVPMGSYKKPTICDDKNIFAVSLALQKVEILCGDYEKTLKEATTNSFFYFDPPYKPLSNTSSFNSYAKDEFNDEEQIQLDEISAQNWKKWDTNGC
jgi:DNA adenine methylase Dam